MFARNKLTRWLPLLGSLVALAVITAACADEEKPVIKFSDTQFQTGWIDNAVAGYIAHHAYGYPVETVEITTPVYQASLPTGEIDVVMELWRSNILDWYNEETAAGRIEDVGQLYEASRQGWYVPTYMIEGDPERGIAATAPNLKTVDDLKQYWELFEDPEDPNMGVWVNCIIGWQCQKVQRMKARFYGLDEFYNVMEPGAAAGIDAAIAGAYQRGDPVLSYYWEPTWIVGAYNLTYLEEPAYTPECNAGIQELLVMEVSVDELPLLDEACAFEEFDIHTGIWSGLRDKAPEVVAFLESMSFGNKTLNELAAYMELEGKTADETAVYFFQNYESKWTQWLPSDAVQKVKDAVADDKVGFSAN